jgi:hypothetical protein
MKSISNVYLQSILCKQLFELYSELDFSSTLNIMVKKVADTSSGKNGEKNEIVAVPVEEEGEEEEEEGEGFDSDEYYESEEVESDGGDESEGSGTEDAEDEDERWELDVNTNGF